MRFVGRGHPAVRATHRKTLELTPDAELTERGTCVVAVGVEPEPSAPVAGAVRVRIAIGDVRFSFDAVANSSWYPHGPVVLRRSDTRLPGTFATEATAAANDLPRELVARLQEPNALVTVDVAPRPGEPTVVLYAADPTASVDARLRAELDRADAVVAEDDDARRLTGARRGDEPDETGRTLVVATRDLPGVTTGELLRAVERVEAVGLPAGLAAAAATTTRGPLLFVPDGVDHRRVLHRAPADHRVVITLNPEDLDAVLADVVTIRGAAAEVVLAQEYRHPYRVADGLPPEITRDAVVHCCIGPGSPSGDEAHLLDPAVRAAVTALLADGVPTRTAARALAALAGWERRRAYAAVLAWPTT